MSVSSFNYFKHCRLQAIDIINCTFSSRTPATACCLAFWNIHDITSVRGNKNYGNENVISSNGNCKYQSNGCKSGSFQVKRIIVFLCILYIHVFFLKFALKGLANIWIFYYNKVDYACHRIFLQALAGLYQVCPLAVCSMRRRFWQKKGNRRWLVQIM